MFWADRLAQEIQERFKGHTEPLLVRDEKTVSGRVHIGSMRGVAIHAAISNALTKIGVANTFSYEFNDFDPMDDIPSYLPYETFKEHLGKPLRNVPSPDGIASSYAEFFANDFRSVIEGAGYAPTFYWSSDLYLSGRMDGVLREAIEGAESIRRIYKEVSGGERTETWLPISVICPTCGKLSTTEATNFDGSTVEVFCRENKVDWTHGCGFKGRVSPFGGNAKLAWKPEWAAKWKVMGVDVEGGGKDHSTKGGSRDVANHIAKEVFHSEPPFDVPYEFFLVGGKKMSSSKGRGSSAREIADLVPAKILRLAMLSKEINQAFNFDPEGDTIPVLYDLYDRFALNYASGAEDDFSRLFTFLHPQTLERSAVPFLPRFSQVAFIAQMPHMDLLLEVEKMKGAPLTEADKAEATERAAYALVWLNAYAPEKFVFKLQTETPARVSELSPLQKKVLGALAQSLAAHEGMPDGEALHHMLHALKESEGIAPGELFGAIYLAFLDKSHGPKAGWFLSVLDKDFVIRRLTEAAA